MQHATVLSGPTAHKARPPYKAHADRLPISLQDHAHPVRFRNIWVRQLKPIEGKRVRPPYMKNGNRETPVEPVPPLSENSK